MRPAGIPKTSGILPRRIFVFLWVFHKLVINYVLTRFRKGISLTFHFLARALTVERTVIGRPPSQCCQIGKLSSKCDHFVPLIRYAISSLATLRTWPPPLVSSFTIVNDLCMWKTAGIGAHGTYGTSKKWEIGRASCRERV